MKGKKIENVYIVLSDVGPVYRKRMSLVRGRYYRSEAQIMCDFFSLFFFNLHLPRARERFIHFFIKRCTLFTNLTLGGGGAGGGQSELE